MEDQSKVDLGRMPAGKNQSLTQEEWSSCFECLTHKSTTYFGPESVVFAWHWTDVLLHNGEHVPRFLLWDLRPLEPGSWESILGFAHHRLFAALKAAMRGCDDPGDNLIDMRRWRWEESRTIEHFPADEPPNVAGLLPGDSRRCYIPTSHHVRLIQRLFPKRRSLTQESTGGETPWEKQTSRRSLTLSRNPCAPPWARIETELLAAGFDPDKLVKMTAPALIELLARVRDGQAWNHIQTIERTEGRSIDKADARVVSPEGTDGPSARKKPAGMGPREAEIFVAAYSTKHPRATVREIAQSVGCSTGTVAKTCAWKVHRDRKQIEKRAESKPRAADMHYRCDGDWHDGMKLIEDKRGISPLDELEAREDELHRRIGDYRKMHPNATDLQIADALGCDVQDIENQRRQLVRLIAEQMEDGRSDGGLGSGAEGKERSKAVRKLA